MSKFQLVGLLMMSTALGVNAANFSPLITNVGNGVNYGLHFIPVILLIIGAVLVSERRVSGQVLVNIVIGLTWAFDLFAIGWAIVHPNPNAFGPHNFNDYSPVVLFTIGAILWFRRQSVVKVESGSRSSLNS